MSEELLFSNAPMTEEEIKENYNDYDFIKNYILLLQEDYEKEHKKALKYCMAYDYYHSILRDLEEYLIKIIKNGANIEKLTCSNILVYLKELKEKYKC